LGAHRHLRIGLALGSGSARGWSHVGVIRALLRAGIEPDIVCGSSIGALVGAAYAAGEIDRLEPWVASLTRQGVMGLLDFRLSSGMIEGRKLMRYFRERFDDPGIEKLPRSFACVATELDSGREVWLRDGPVIDAVRASIALPGLFTPMQRDGRLLVDGGLVNPVPVSLCRAMGADVVVAVDLNWDLVGRRTHSAPSLYAEPRGAPSAPARARTLDSLWKRLWPSSDEPPALPMPSMLGVLAASLNIMQVRITNSRLAGEPADVVVRPRVASIGPMDYHRGEEAMAAGQRAAEHVLPMLQELLA
jgi:NTE family protein